MKQAIKGIHIGDRVQILTPVNFKFGYINHIDGGYNYVRTGAKGEVTIELYPNEFKVVQRYKSRLFKVGDNVRLLAPEKLPWGKTRQRLGGVVIGITRGRIVVKTHAGRGRSHTFLIAAGDLEKTDAPLLTPPAPRLCQHCGADLRKPASAA